MQRRTTIGFDAKRIVANASGLGNYSRTLINALIKEIEQEKGQEDLFLNLYTPKYGNKDLRQQVSSSEILSYHYPSTKLHNLWREKLIVKDLKQDKVSLFHGLTGQLPYGIKTSGIKSIVTIHDIIFLVHPEFYPLIDRKLYTLKFFNAIRQADKIIAISNCTKKDIIRYGKVEEEKIEVIYQPCSKKFSQNLDTQKSKLIKQKYNLFDEFILNVGSIEKRKNILLCIKAIENKENINLVIVGKWTKYCKEIETYIEKHHLNNRIKIFHNISNEDLPYFYDMAKFFIYPSIYEGFGLPLIEAIQMNKAVIAAKGSCLEEAGGDNNIYVDPYNVEDCSNAIMELWNNEQKRNSMVISSKEYIKRFDNSNIAQTYLSIYKKILQQKQDF